MTFDRYQHNQEARRNALIDAAVVAFAEDGFEGARTRNIAERAGCSEGLIHRYFGGKRGLLQAILAQRGEEVARGITEEVPLGETLEAEIGALLRWQIRRLGAKKPFLTVVFTQAITDPEVGDIIRNGVGERRTRVFAERLRTLQQAGKVATSVDIETLAETISTLGFSLGFVQQIALHRDPIDLEVLASRMARLLAGAAHNPADPLIATALMTPKEPT